MRLSLSRSITALLVAFAASVMVAPTAFADPAGPTDYQSAIVSVAPATTSITPGIIGGDSFFELSVRPGTEVFVVGYQGENTIWFRPDGTVWENRNSPSTYLNADRLGGASIPATATADAAPDWKQVADDGGWAWHDHRAHWMQEARPFGLGPGDQILESVIPVIVDGTDVEITVISTWKPAPSPLPAILGALAGLATAGAAVLLRRGSIPALFAAMPAVAFAVLAGVWQYASLPSETGPRLVWWVLPVIAAVSVTVGLVAGRGSHLVADGALLVVGVELAVWGFIKRDGLGAAIVPTDAPGWLDRFATATALVAGVAMAALALWWLFGPQQSDATRRVNGPRARKDSRRPAHP